MLSTLNNTNLPSPLTIPENVRIMIRENLRKKLLGETMGGHCFFRRFNYFLSTENIHSITKNIDHNTSIICDNFDGISPEDMDRYMEIKYRSFSGITYGDCVRPENSEQLKDKKIILRSKNYSQVDFTLNYTFEFSNILRSSITPVRGDLLFIFVSQENLGKYKNLGSVPSTDLYADKWCIVSDQFLHMYSAIMYDWDNTFQLMMPKKMQNSPLEEREKILKNKLFTGNRLMTNSWLKYKLALEDNGQKLSKEESQKRYWHLRTEFAARKWVDVYAAIVLAARYGELPCPNNVPDYVQGPDSRVPVFHRKKWNLPSLFMTNFLRSILEGSYIYCCEELVNYTTVQNVNGWECYYPSHTRALLGNDDDKTDIEYGLLDKLAMSRSDKLDDTIYTVMYGINGDAKKIAFPMLVKGDGGEISQQSDVNNTIARAGSKSEPLPTHCTWAKVVTRHTTSSVDSNENVSCSKKTQIVEKQKENNVSIVSINLPCSPSAPSTESNLSHSSFSNNSVQIDISNTSSPNTEGTIVENTVTIQLQFDLPGKWSDILMEDEK